MQWIAWGIGQFFKAAFNGEKRAIDRLVDGNPAHWGKYIHGYRVENPAEVLSALSPAEAVVLIFAVDKAPEIKRAVAEFGPFPTLAMGDLLRTEAPQWSDFQARRDMSLAAWDLATRESSDYVYQHLGQSRKYWDRITMLEEMAKRASQPGLFLEFGVARGESLRAIAACTGREVHGFDSFEGLPESWGLVLPQGAFACERPQGLPPNVQLHVGWFEDTLPGFVAETPGPVAFLHLDCDLYPSAKTVFRHLAGRIQPGTLIVFDEYLNYPGWREHEFKAFQEFVAFSQCRYEYLGVVMNSSQVAVRIL